MKTWLKSAVALILALVLFCAPALAETVEPAPAQPYSVSAKGQIIRPNPVMLLAPLGGQTLDFGWVVGDTVLESDIAIALRPTELRAPQDGVIASLRAHIGDTAEHVQGQYGALCYIERQDVWHIDASTTNAYDDPDNRDIRVGQEVRVQQGTGDDKIKGTGTVISVEGKEYVVELPQDDFELEKTVKLYLKDSKDNANRDQVGSGKIVRAPAIPVTGSGIVAKVLVKDGDKVEKGDPLFILDEPHAHHDDESDLSSDIPFGQDAIIADIFVRPGQFVQQGQALIALYPAQGLQASLEVDELDIAKVRIGDAIRVKIDAFDQERTATVTEIRPIGLTVLDTTKFDVRVTFEQANDLMIGMHVTGYWS